MAEVLRVENLKVRYRTPLGDVNAVNDVNFSLQERSILCLVGESGSGKTTIALALLGLLPDTAEVLTGSVSFQGVDLLRIPGGRLRRLRGQEISMVFQDPPSALNPIETIGTQIEELIRTHTDKTKAEAYHMAEEALVEMGLPDPRLILTRYPFELSGGQCQRVMLGMSLVLRPKVLIADEPTSNIDVTLQAEIMDRLKSHCKDLGCSIVWITHDMGVVAHMADEVAVMYGGSIVEHSGVYSLFRRPYHPYTWGIFQSLPRLDQADRRLEPLRGNPPDLLNLPDQCPYVDRCPKAVNRCRVDPMPLLKTIEDDHLVACYNTVDHHWMERANGDEATG